VSVHILSHNGKWINGRVRHCWIPGEPPGAVLELDADDNIEGGTSGGPVIDGQGRLVGIVSNASGTKGSTKEGRIPLVCRSLPIWVWDIIKAAEAMR
jgi:hypothetical protein